TKVRPYIFEVARQQNDDVAFVAEGDFQDAGSVLENAEHPDDGRWVDRLAERLIVKADVAAGDRRAERIAGFGEAVDGLRKLPHHFGLFRAAEIEAIRCGDGARTAASHVAGGFGDRVHCAYAGIQLAPAAIAISRKSECPLHYACLRIFDTHH